MSLHFNKLSAIPTLTLALAIAVTSPVFAEIAEIALRGDHAYPESISATPEGTLYVGSPAVGGVRRIKSQTGAVEEWIKPGAFGSRSILGVLVDSKANLLWVCSNDFSSVGIAGPSSVPGSFVKGFDLSSGEGKVSVQPSFVAPQSPMRVPGRSCGCSCEISRTIVSTVVLAKLFFASAGRHAERSTAVPFLTALLTIASSDRSM
jgi:hypothetical protein